MMALYPDRRLATRYSKELQVVVDRERARFSTWYEMFPHSCAPKPGAHGTFKDCEQRLPYIAGMGFDVLYLPPIHPIGRTHRKGKNNSPTAGNASPNLASRAFSTRQSSKVPIVCFPPRLPRRLEF